MTPAEFLRALQADWSRTLTEDEADSVLLSAQKYTPQERETIRQAMKQLPTSTYFRPQLIDATAQDCGIWPARRKQQDGDGPKRYVWNVESDSESPECEKCEDMGLRWMLVEPEMDAESRKFRRRLVTYLPPSKAHTPKEPNQYLVMRRCDCKSGGRQPEKAWETK